MSQVPEFFDGFAGVHIVAVERETCYIHEFFSAPLVPFFRCFTQNGGSAETMEELEEALEAMFSISTTQGFVKDLRTVSHYRCLDQDAPWKTDNGGLTWAIPTSRITQDQKDHRFKSFTFLF